MKTTLKIANALSWFNLFFWGIPILIDILRALSTMNIPMLGLEVLICSIPLQSYAALQLHKSIRHPQIKLSHNTPAGLRFVGFIALCFGGLFIFLGLGVLLYAPELLKIMLQQKVDFGLGPMTLTLMRELGGSFLVLGLAAAINVVLNLRLLRWYYLVHQSDVS